MNRPEKETPESLLYAACNEAIREGVTAVNRLHLIARNPDHTGSCRLPPNILLEAARVIEHQRSLMALLLARDQE